MSTRGKQVSHGSEYGVRHVKNSWVRIRITCGSTRVMPYEELEEFLRDMYWRAASTCWAASMMSSAEAISTFIGLYLRMDSTKSSGRPSMKRRFIDPTSRGFNILSAA